MISCRYLWVCLALSLMAGCADSRVEAPIELAGIQLPDLDGQQRPLIDNSHRIRIINFWATWCAPCREEMPDLQRLDEMLDDQRYQVIGVTIDRDLNLAREFVLKYGIRFEQRYDAEMAVASGVLNIQAYPETLLVDVDGKVIDRVVGVRPWGDPAFVQRFLQPVEGKE